MAGGFAAGAVQSGSLKGGLYGAFSGALFFGIGSYFDAGTQASAWARTGDKLNTIGRVSKIVAHGSAGGITSSLQGGKFAHGFASAGFSEAAGPLTQGIETQAARGVVHAMIGGTASSLSGGKFANGAVTAAMSFAFNTMAHEGASQASRREQEEPFWSDELASRLDSVRGILERPAGEDGVKSITVDELHYIMETEARMLDMRSSAAGGYRNMSLNRFSEVLWGVNATGDSVFYGRYGGDQFRIVGAPGGLSAIQVGGDINYLYQGMLHAARGNHFSTAYNSVVTYNLAFKGADRIPNRLRWTAYGYDFYNRRGR
ncbi:MAG: hypothetical protein MEQ07_04945 [Aquimonas sp.]|nr:hypothetical protein [Aquimonas sp.]